MDVFLTCVPTAANVSPVRYCTGASVHFHTLDGSVTEVGIKKYNVSFVVFVSLSLINFYWYSSLTL